MDADPADCGRAIFFDGSGTLEAILLSADTV